MQTKMIQSISLCIVLALTFMFFPYFAQAGQSETSVACDEGVIPEPIPINYGDHTTNCGINTNTDIDQFTFVGSAGDNIRINVSSTTSNWWDPRIEIRDPDGIVISDTHCNGAPICSFSVDLSLILSGTYLMAISDSGLNDTGNYTLQLEKIPPSFDPPGIPYNSTVSDGINPTTDMDFLVFGGETGTDIRINVSSTTSNWWDPRLEIWDPDGTVIEDTHCNGSPTCSFSVDLSLTLSGTYLMAISDSGLNDTGNYQTDLQCLFGPCPDVIQPVVCDIQMNQASYTVGDTVTAQVARIANPGPDPVAIEIKTWFEGTEISPASDINIGSDGTYILAPEYDQDFGPMPLVTVTPDIPLGTYEYNCRMIDPVTGRPVTLDRNPFDIQ